MSYLGAIMVVVSSAMMYNFSQVAVEPIKRRRGFTCVVDGESFWNQKELDEYYRSKYGLLRGRYFYPRLVDVVWDFSGAAAPSSMHVGEITLPSGLPEMSIADIYIGINREAESDSPVGFSDIKAQFGMVMPAVQGNYPIFADVYYAGNPVAVLIGNTLVSVSVSAG